MKLMDYITPEEATRLGEQLCIIDAKRAEGYVRDFYGKHPNNGDAYNFFWFAAVMFNAGCVAGIRSERASKRKRKGCINE